MWIWVRLTLRAFSRAGATSAAQVQGWGVVASGRRRSEGTSGTSGRRGTAAAAAAKACSSTSAASSRDHVRRILNLVELLSLPQCMLISRPVSYFDCLFCGRLCTIFCRLMQHTHRSSLVGVSDVHIDKLLDPGHHRSVWWFRNFIAMLRCSTFQTQGAYL